MSLSIPTSAPTLRAPQPWAQAAPSIVDRPVNAAVSSDAAMFSAWRTRAAFLVPDLAALAVIAVVIWGGVGLLGGTPSVHLLPLVILIPAAFALTGLYNAVSLHPAEELELCALMTTLVLGAYAVPVCIASPADASLGLMAAEFAAAWALGIVFLTGFRAVVRVLVSRTEWWGTPAVVIASGPSARGVIQTLRRWPELGLKPVAVFHDGPAGQDVEDLPSWGGTHLAPTAASRHKVPYAILARPDLSPQDLSETVRRYGRFFERILVVPSAPTAHALWTAGGRFDGLMGYCVRDGARCRSLQAAKRVVDLTLAIAGLVILSPLLLGLAVLVRLDSPGPVLFSQVRLGFEGRCFPLLKFRTMYADAEDRLQALLDADPERADEYRRYHKLRDDPRVTRIGRVLRTYSLDELPQLVNVILGHLSLVGPRAYLPRELADMGGLERAVLQSRPGITGLWQVSGRNRLPFAERLTLDVHYAQNWTPWLDLYLLAKTIPVVVCGEGS